ncbi:MAG TPA: hypothetical protein PKC59_04085 [Burkholderiaceae bacterium]|nr:hypothetical protein [Burkholderiaceae bacterium]HMX09340.1 hypothetical protein [Burkholderiaceae bacterium]HMY98298.1 hypothetical protein [Burkholderiaceae bacterium]HNB44436.1 hypothetical protein [Burkholderiaceae bacterium]
MAVDGHPLVERRRAHLRQGVEPVLDLDHVPAGAIADHPRARHPPVRLLVQAQEGVDRHAQAGGDGTGALVTGAVEAEHDGNWAEAGDIGLFAELG